MVDSTTSSDEEPIRYSKKKPDTSSEEDETTEEDKIELDEEISDNPAEAEAETNEASHVPPID